MFYSSLDLGYFIVGSLFFRIMNLKEMRPKWQNSQSDDGGRSTEEEEKGLFRIVKIN
jgi:hypothetical protein